MTRIAAQTMVAVPAHDVPALAEHYLRSLPYNEHEGAHAVLRGRLGSIAVGCEVLLKMTSVRTAPGLEVLDVHWHPLGDEPYPTFIGTLCADQEDGGSCLLVLSGEYVPPGWIAGAAFDALAGHFIAQESIRDLLGTLKTEFEALHAVQMRHLSAIAAVG